jgi:hypothetical protein
LPDGFGVDPVAQSLNYSRDFLRVWQRSCCSRSRCKELWSLISVRTFTPICSRVSNSSLSGRRRFLIVLSVWNIFISTYPIESAGLRLFLYAGIFRTHSRLPASPVRQ